MILSGDLVNGRKGLVFLMFDHGAQKIENLLKLQIREHPGESAAVVAGAVKVVNSSFVLEVFALSPRYCAALPESYCRSALAFVAPLKKLGYLTVDLSEADVFDTGIIASVHPQPDHYSQAARLDAFRCA